MSCPAPELLGAAATIGDDAVLAHAATCETCQLALDDQLALRALIQRTPAVVLTRDRRAAMAAELMAQADRLPTPAERIEESPPVLTRERRDAMAADLMAQADRLPAPAIRTSRRSTFAFVAAGLAAAAAIAIVVAVSGSGSDGQGTQPAIAAGSDQPAAIGSGSPAAPEPAPAAGSASLPDVVAKPALAPVRPAPRTSDPSATAKLEGTGDYARDARGTASRHDVVRLRGGELTVDSTSSRPVEVVSGTTAIAVKRARIKVIATKGVVSSVAVFAGSAEVTVDGHRVIVEAGTVWERDATRDDSLEAFRVGWAALRAGNNAEAIAAFDRAVDPIVAEDATYWSAIASERAGDNAKALERYRELLAKFPKTTREAEARAALARLAPATAP